MKRHSAKRGAISGRPPENEPWVWMTLEMLQSTTWGALSISARRILDALLLEHLSNGGRENGNLAVTYRQLAAFGVSKNDIYKGLTELQICGFIRLVKQGFRMSGGGEPSRFAITWLVTFLATPNAAVPSDDWRGVIIKRNRAGQTTVRQVRRWLKDQVAAAGRSHTVKPAAQPQDIEGAPQMGAEAWSQMGGENTAKIFKLAPQVKGGLPPK
jgi:hypothetical protein